MRRAVLSLILALGVLGVGWGVFILWDEAHHPEYAAQRAAIAASQATATTARNATAALLAATQTAQRNATATAEANYCGNAVTRVQQFQQPGQRTTTLTEITARLAAEQRPVKVDGWEPPERLVDDCWVTFRVLISGEPQRYSWEYTPKTGKVTARDDATKRLSGW